MRIIQKVVIGVLVLAIISNVKAVESEESDESVTRTGGHRKGSKRPNKNNNKKTTSPNRSQAGRMPIYGNQQQLISQNNRIGPTNAQLPSYSGGQMGPNGYGLSNFPVNQNINGYLGQIPSYAANFPYPGMPFPSQNFGPQNYPAPPQNFMGYFYGNPNLPLTGPNIAQPFPGQQNNINNLPPGQQNNFNNYPTGPNAIQPLPGQQNNFNNLQSMPNPVQPYPGQQNNINNLPPGQQNNFNNFPNGPNGIQTLPGQQNNLNNMPLGPNAVQPLPGQQNNINNLPPGSNSVQPFPGQQNNFNPLSPQPNPQQRYHNNFMPYGNAPGLQLGLRNNDGIPNDIGYSDQLLVGPQPGPPANLQIRNIEIQLQPHLQPLPF